MAITISVAASDTDLTTVATVKDVLRLTGTARDSDINRLIRAATSAIEEYVRHTFAKQTYLETLTGQNSPILLLTNTPIVGTPLVTTGGSPIVDFAVQDADVGSLYREAGWATGEWIGWGATPSYVRGTAELIYAVTYEAGYVTPGLTDPDLPGQVEQACIETVVAWYHSQKTNPNAASKKIGDLQITYKSGLAAIKTLGLPATARALLSGRIR